MQMNEYGYMSIGIVALFGYMAFSDYNENKADATQVAQGLNTKACFDNSLTGAARMGSMDAAVADAISTKSSVIRICPR